VRSAWLRVLTNTSVVTACFIAAKISGMVWRARWPAHGT
jgi:hypothetical protein